MGNESTLSSQEQTLLQQARTILDDLIAPEMSDLEKAYKIHDYIVDHADYLIDERLSTDNALGSFEYGKAQCSGYTDAFYLLGRLAGLEVDAICGDVIDDDGDDRHTWNLIQLDNQWYAVDVTWDDSSDVNTPSGFEYYLNLPNDLLRTTRTWDAAQEPEGRYAVSVDDNWYPGVPRVNSVEAAMQTIASEFDVDKLPRIILAENIDAEEVALGLAEFGYYGYAYYLYEDLPGLRLMEYVKE